MSKRDKYQTRQAFLGNEMNREAAKLLIDKAPLDPLRPLEVLIREQVKQRGLDVNSLMWAGPLRDISEQVWVQGRRYSAEVWHEHFKEQYLPEEFDPELTKEGYIKWDTTPSGKRVLIGSSTDLTVKGFSQYLEQIHAFGAGEGVHFHANPRERQAA